MVDDHARENMEQVLADVRNGRFAREWITENQANRPTYRQLRQGEKAHEIEAVGERLRGLFAWAEAEGEDEDESEREEVRA